MSEDDDEEEEVANTEEIDDKDDVDTHAAEVEEKDDEHVGQDNASEAVESLPDEGEAQDQLDGKDHDDIDMNVREDAGSHPSAEKGDQNVDTSATEDDLPPKRVVPSVVDCVDVVSSAVKAKSSRGKRRLKFNAKVTKKSRSKVKYSWKSGPSRERRSKQSLDFPTNDFNSLESPAVDDVRQFEDDVQEISPSFFAGSSVRSPSIKPSSRNAMCSEECVEVLAKVKAGKPVNDGLNVRFDKHCSTEISFDDPYLLSSVADKSAVQEEMGKASRDLQMSQRPVGDLSEEDSVLPANPELSKCAADEIRSFGDLQMSLEKSVPSPKNGTSTLQDVRLFSENASNSEMVGDDDIRRVTEGCNPSSALKVRGDTVLSPRQSVHAGMEVKSADLQMPGDVVAASGVDMSENILQDTLLDLSPMSPKVEFKKVTLFSNIPFSGFTAAKILENMVKYEVFRECPKFKYNKKGRQTDSSKESRNM